MPESRAYRRVMAEQAGVDAQNLQALMNRFSTWHAEIEVMRGEASHRAATDALRGISDAFGEFRLDHAIPTLQCAMDDLEQEFRVSREGAVDSEE